MGSLRDRLLKEYGCTLCEYNVYHEAPGECKYLPPIAGGVSPVSPVGVSPPPPPTQPFLVPSGGAAGAKAGSLWIESTELHYISTTTTNEYAETGSITSPNGGSPTPLVGSMWVESNDTHYVDSAGNERVISKTAMPAAPGGAVLGSMWLENSAPTPTGQQVQWIGSTSTNRYKWWNGF